MRSHRRRLLIEFDSKDEFHVKFNMVKFRLYKSTTKPKSKKSSIDNIDNFSRKERVQISKNRLKSFLIKDQR